MTVAHAAVYEYGITLGYRHPHNVPSICRSL